MPDFSAYIAERTKNFIGCAWAFERITGWLAVPAAERIYLVGGGPGSGKTGLAARLVQSETAGNFRQFFVNRI